MTNFQLIFTGLFVAFIIFGVLSFALYSSSNKNTVGAVVVWGTVDQNLMTQMLQNFFQTDRSFENVTYIQKDPNTYTATLINAMAGGSGPDLVLITQDELQNFSDKLDTIPYSTVSQATFTSSYIDEGQLFLNPQGAVALPFVIDPLVMYWNRDLFATAGIPQPPQYWNDLLTMAPKLTVLNGSSNVTQSAAALGEWSNILYAKNIVAALFMQAGDSIVLHNAAGLAVSNFGATPPDATENPAASALQFYTEFANPSKITYSWNRSLPSSEDSFTAGTLAVYVGFASDAPIISARNPNLHFGVAALPQIQGSSTHLTFGTITGLAIPRTARNAQGALVIAQKLSSPTGTSAIASALSLPSVRVDVPTDTSANANASVFSQSALIARGWYDPDPASTSDIFKTMIESVISGQLLPDQAVSEASRSMEVLVSTGSTN